jgi:hypothetical protein
MRNNTYIFTRKLTKEEEEFHKSLIDADEFRIKTNADFYELKSKCVHPVLVVNMWDVNVWDVDVTGTVQCAICGHDFGWWCPDSPDEYCHYEDHKEECIYCGCPEERK